MAADVPSLSGSIPQSVVLHVLLHACLKSIARYNIVIVLYSWSLGLIEASAVKDLT